MRLIDADVLIADCNLFNSWDGQIVKAWVDDQPTVDAVEVIRCKDCKYWQDNNGGYPHDGCKWNADETPDPDDYCSRAERKEE